MAKVTPVPLRHKEKDSKVPLYLRLSAGDRIRYLSLGIKIHKRHWNAKQKRVRKSHGQHARINALISRRLSEAQGAILDLRREGLTVTPKRLKERLTKEENGRPDLIQFGRKVVRRFEKNGQIDTAKRHNSVLNKLESYVGGRLPFEEVTPSFLADYKAHLADKHGNKQNTIAGDLSNIRSTINKAVDEGIIEPGDNPFLSYSIEHAKPERERLTLEEIRRLEALDLEDEPELQEARDAFLLAFYAQGMRIRDVMLLRHSNIRDGRLVYRMSKTDEAKDIQSVPPARKIVDRCRKNSRSKQANGEADPLLFSFLRGRDLSTPEAMYRAAKIVTKHLNGQLHALAERADLQTRVSFHQARHAFASLALERGWDVAEISKALGHADLSTTQKYLRGFSDRDLDGKMSTLFGGVQNE